MRVECPTCKKICLVSDDRVFTVQKPLEVKCSSCKSFIRMSIKAEVPKEPSPTPKPSQTAFSDYDLTLLDTGDEPRIPVMKSKILRSLIDLPSMPHIILKAQEIMADPDSSLRDLSKVIENDQAIVARVLTMANSAYYGISGMVSSIQHASVLLGQKTLGELVTISASSELLSKNLKGYRINPETMWKHSLATAFGAKMIAEMRQPESIEDAFIVGLLHDAGKIILDPYVLMQKTIFEKFLRRRRTITSAAEKGVLGFDHAEIMARACRFWRFPETQIIGIRYHHYPSLSADSHLAYIIHLADYLSKAAGFDSVADAAPEDIEQEVLDFLELKEENLAGIEARIIESVEKIEEELQEA